MALLCSFCGWVIFHCVCVCVCVCVSSFPSIHLLMDTLVVSVCVCVCVCVASCCRHFGCLCVLAVINRTAVNIGVRVSFRVTVFSEYVPRDGIAELCGRSVFSFLGNLHPVLQSGSPSSHSFRQCRRVAFSPVTSALKAVNFFSVSLSS